MMIVDDDHLKGEARQGAGEVVQAGAGQVTCRFEFHLRFSDDQVHLYSVKVLESCF